MQEYEIRNFMYQKQKLEGCIFNFSSVCKQAPSPEKAEEESGAASKGTLLV